MIYFSCTNCSHVEVARAGVISSCKRAGIQPPCSECGSPMALKAATEHGRTENQRRSQAQEKRAAKRVGGRVTPASGAGVVKGDVEVRGKLRMECKFTRSSSYVLKRDLLEKIEKEALAGEQPAFEIEFQDVQPHKRYVVLPGWLYDHYVNLAGDK